jgi:hypothetical protein
LTGEVLSAADETVNGSVTLTMQRRHSFADTLGERFLMEAALSDEGAIRESDVDGHDFPCKSEYMIFLSILISLI